MTGAARAGTFLLAWAACLLASGAHAAAPGPAADPYEILQRHGLLKPAPAQPAAPASPRSATLESTPVAPSRSAGGSPASSGHAPAAAAASAPPETHLAVAEAASAAEAPPSALARAYAMLRSKGLLPGGLPAGPHALMRPRHRPGAEKVLVDKSDRRLYLLKDGKPYREYRVSLGGVPVGHKQRAGDLKTPEGVYTLDWRNPRSRYYKSIHISYPNENDRLRALERGVDPGGSIMIHGEHYLPAMRRTLRRAATPKDWTEGCIALLNEHMDEVWREVADGTPIEIRP